jgi:hypothetical protein
MVIPAIEIYETAKMVAGTAKEAIAIFKDPNVLSAQLFEHESPEYKISESILTIANPPMKIAIPSISTIIEIMNKLNSRVNT